MSRIELFISTREDEGSSRAPKPKTLGNIKADLAAKKLLENAVLQGVTTRHVARQLPRPVYAAAAEDTPVSLLSPIVDLTYPPPTDPMTSRVFTPTMLANLLGAEAAALIAKAAESAANSPPAGPPPPGTVTGTAVGASIASTASTVVGASTASKVLPATDYIPTPKTRCKREMPNPRTTTMQNPLAPHRHWSALEESKSATKSIFLNLIEGPPAGSCLWFDWVFEETTLLIVVSLPRTTSVMCHYVNCEDAVSLRFQRQKDPQLWSCAPSHLQRIAKNLQHISPINEWTVEVALPSGVLSLNGSPPMRFDEESEHAPDEIRTYFTFELEHGPPEKKSKAQTSSSLGKCL